MHCSKHTKFHNKVRNTKLIRKNHFAFVHASMFDISPYSRFKSLPMKHIPIGERNQENINKKVYKICGYSCIENDVLCEAFSGT